MNFSSIKNSIQIFIAVAALSALSACGVTTGNPSGEGSAEQGLRTGDNDFQHDVGVFSDNFPGLAIEKIEINVLRASLFVNTGIGPFEIPISGPTHIEMLKDSSERIGTVEIPSTWDKYVLRSMVYYVDEIIVTFVPFPGGAQHKVAVTDGFIVIFYPEEERVFFPSSPAPGIAPDFAALATMLDTVSADDIVPTLSPKEPFKAETENRAAMTLAESILKSILYFHFR